MVSPFALLSLIRIKMKVRLVMRNKMSYVFSASFHSALYLCALTLRHSDAVSLYVSVQRIGSTDVDWYCIYYTDEDSGNKLYNFVESESFINMFRKRLWACHDSIAGLV